MDSGKLFILSIPQNVQNAQPNHVTGEEISAEYLSFKLVNKRSRVRLSDKPIDYSRLPGKSRLLAVGNKVACLAAVICKDDGYYIAISPLDDLQKALERSSESENFIQFIHKKSPMKLPGTPHILTFALNDECLIIAFIDGSILAYDVGLLLQTNQTYAQPYYSISGSATTVARDIVPNPEENKDLVAILRETQSLEHHVDIFDVRNQKHVVGWRQSNAETAPVSICWSPKGKQFGIGLKSGDALLYSLASPDVPKSRIPRPPSIPLENSALLAITWISNTAWHLVFSTPEACFANFDTSSSSSLTKTHIMAIIDPRKNINTTIELGDPSAPFGAQVGPGPLFLVLRNWDPMKYMVVCGDGPSADIGVIGSSTGDSWANLSLEETATPSLPLNDDMEDMPLLGFQLDFTSRERISLSDQPGDGMPELPPSPILYAYLSDGTVVGWRILNSNGDSYSGMVTAGKSTALPVQRPAVVESPGVSAGSSALPKPSPMPTTSSFAQKPSAFGQQTTSSSAIAPAKGFGAFATPTSSSRFGGTGFGFSTGASTSDPISKQDSNTTTSLPPAFSGPPKTHVPTFGTSGYSMQPAAPAFGVSSFGARPQSTFGTSGFGAKPVFGQSGFANVSNAPKSASVPSAGGFAAFAGKGTSGFGVQSSSNVLESPSAPAQSPFTTATASNSFTETRKAPTTSASQPTNIASDTQLDDAGSFGGLTGFRDALESHPAAPAGEDSPPLGSVTPEGSPKAPAQLASTTPASAYIKPASGFGAFGGSSTSTASYIKPAQGFGAFGGGTSSKSATVDEKKSGFPSNTDTKSVTPTPVFGSTTALGNRHPGFGRTGFGVTPPKPAVSEPSQPISGGFSAFSSGSGFAAYANAGGKSFSDLLSSSDSDPPKAIESAVPSPSNLRTALSQPDAPLVPQASKQPSILDSPKVEKEDASQDKEELSSVDKAHTEQELPPMDGSVSQSSSFSLVSLHDESGPEGDEETAQSSTEKREVESDKNSEEFYVSESAYGGGDEESIEERSVPSSPEPASALFAAEIPLPETPSPAATPTPPTPKPTPAQLSTPEELIPETKPATKIEMPDRSTTPPHSPQKPPTPFPNLPVPASPKPVSAVPGTPSPSGFGFGLGRPSSRPIRSSPLANAPITNEDDVAEPAVGISKQNTGLPSPTLPSTPSVAPTPPAQKRPKTPPPLFGKGMTSPVQMQSVLQPAPTPVQQTKFFGNNDIPLSAPIAGRAFPLKPPTTPIQPELHPLQTEFLRAYEEVRNDIVKVVEAHNFLSQTYPHPSRGGLEALVKENREFVVNPMFSLAEAKFFKSIIDRLRTEVLLLEEQCEADRRLLQTVQNLALISDTKKEELERWVRAKKNPELAKTLKPRQLGPEHAENQIKLRKALQTVHERVQQCEDEVDGLKKKLEQEKSGRVAFHPPTLDTIDRICRNIQLALDERTKALGQLNSRIEAMSTQTSKILKSSQASSPAMAPTSPPFASVAAAALNSERSALKLRAALLETRKRPLLTMASYQADAEPFDAQPGPSYSLPNTDWQQPLMNSGAFSTGMTITPIAPSTPISGSASRRRGTDKKSNAVPLKSSPVSATSANKPSFDWGPLPGVTPMKTISSDVRTPKK